MQLLWHKQGVHLEGGTRTGKERPRGRRNLEFSHSGDGMSSKEEQIFEDFFDPAVGWIIWMRLVMFSRVVASCSNEIGKGRGCPTFRLGNLTENAVSHAHGITDPDLRNHQR